jgi:hypothetical protein
MDGAEAEQQSQAIGSYRALRNAIGWLAFGLPWAVFLGYWIIFSHHDVACLVPIGDKLPDSLSGYYYSHMRDVFVGSMCAAGVFLMFYRGRHNLERRLTNLAGLCAVGIALFPTTRPVMPVSSCGPVIQAGMPSAPVWSAWLHAVFLVVLMVAVAWVILCWQRSDAKRSDIEQKRKKRNKSYYYACIAFMVIAGALALIQEVSFDKQTDSLAPWLLYAEAIAFLAFGVAWFVNGQPIRQLWNSLQTAGNSLRAATKSLAKAIPRQRSKQSAGAGAGNDQ